jgi:hypothetical protein
MLCEIARRMLSSEATKSRISFPFAPLLRGLADLVLQMTGFMIAAELA